MAQRLMGVIKKGPDTTSAVSFGEPSLVDPVPVAASDVPRRETLGMAEPGGKNTVGVEIVKPDESGANKPGVSSTATPPGSSPFGAPANPQPAAPDPNELKPNVPADPNELKPTDNGGDQTLPPPAQVNEIQQGQSSSSSSSSAGADNSTPASDQDLSSSKKRKKKGLKKIVPF